MANGHQSIQEVTSTMVQVAASKTSASVEDKPHPSCSGYRMIAYRQAQYWDKEESENEQPPPLQNDNIICYELRGKARAWIPSETASPKLQTRCNHLNPLTYRRTYQQPGADTTKKADPPNLNQPEGSQFFCSLNEQGGRLQMPRIQKITSMQLAEECSSCWSSSTQGDRA